MSTPIDTFRGNVLKSFSMPKDKPQNGKGTWISVRVPRDLADQIKVLAKDEDRSRSKIIVRLIRNALRSGNIE
jgi:hypothetical protein